MKIDPLAPQLLIDYDYFCRIFGPMDFAEFIPLWHAADALMEAALDEGFEPHEAPHLILDAAKPTETVH